MSKTQTIQGHSIQQISAPCTLGWFIAGATDKGLCYLALGDTPDSLRSCMERRFPKAVISPAHSTPGTDMEVIAAFVNGRSDHWGMNLDIKGTPFQQKVWNGLTTIPPGTTLSYSELAKRIGRPGSVRAVANACGANPLALVIPCHRVIRSDGSLGGYRWGIERKKTLLEREKEHDA